MQNLIDGDGRLSCMGSEPLMIISPAGWRTESLICAPHYSTLADGTSPEVVFHELDL